MWGYRNPEFEQLGKFPARLDDLLNWLPARLTGWLLVLAAWPARADGRNAARTMLAQHDRTASLNAGWTMSAMAGALRVTLTKQGVYELAGGQKTPDGSTIRQALRVADICAGLSVVLLAIPTLWRGVIQRY
jgi:adenosylcobinamide-phosphate synthase